MGFTLSLLVALASGVVQTFADPLEIPPGPLSASLSASPAFSSKTTSHSAQNSDSSTVVLTADDSRGTSPASLGWDVSLSASALTDTVSGTYTIPLSAISVQALGTLGSTNGSLTGVSSGAGDGPLNSGRIVMSAEATQGVGTYTEDVTFRIVVPANVHPGTYVGTITITIITR